jgi:hypothetical protein
MACRRPILAPCTRSIGASHEEWDGLFRATRPNREDRATKQALLAEWHHALVQTVKEIEWAYSALEALNAKESTAAQATERKRRKMEGRVTLREFLSLPISPDDEALRDLHLTSRTGAEMKLEVLLFAGTEEHNVTNLNLARELFQTGKVPQAMWGLYYIRDGERSAGYGWEKPFLDEVYVHNHR